MPLGEAGATGPPPRAGFFASRFESLAELARRKTGRRASPGHPTLPPLLQRVLAVAQSAPAGGSSGSALVLAVIGWGVGTQIETQSDIRALAPQNVDAVRDLNELQDATGVSGELDVSVRGPRSDRSGDDPWMAAFKRRVLQADGSPARNPSCQEAEVCPGPALSDFVTGGGLTAADSGPLTRRGIRLHWADPRLRPAAGGAGRSEDRPARPERRCSASASAPSRWRTSRR